MDRGAAFIPTPRVLSLAAEPDHRLRGVRTPLAAAGISREWCLPSLMAGEALAHVQGESLKASAAVCGRFLNSPVTSGSW